MIDVVQAYGNRIIEGVDKNDILKASQDKSETYSMHKNILHHNPSNRDIVLSCVWKYFEPEKSYYHLGEKDACGFIQRALGVFAAEGNCKGCVRQCLTNGLKIKKNRIVVSQEYFTK